MPGQLRAIPRNVPVWSTAIAIRPQSPISPPDTFPSGRRAAGHWSGLFGAQNGEFGRGLRQSVLGPAARGAGRGSARWVSRSLR